MSAVAWLITGCITLFVLACVALAVLYGLACRADRDDRRRARRVPAVAVIAGRRLGQDEADYLALVCGPCNNVPGAWRCACAGNCGAQACTGGTVADGLSGELQQITRQTQRTT